MHITSYTPKIISIMKEEVAKTNNILYKMSEKLKTIGTSIQELFIGVSYVLILCISVFLSITL